MASLPRAGALAQPHDALFRWTFSKREHAVGLLNAALPEELCASIDWTTLRPEKGSYVDHALRSRHSDLVLRLIDLSKGQANELRERSLTAAGRVSLWAFSVAGDDARLKREMGLYEEAIDEMLRAPDGLAAFEAFVRYLLATHARMSGQKVIKLMEKTAGPAAREAIVTWLDEIELRGERRGERKGQAKNLLVLLEARFGLVPAEVSAKVMDAKAEVLSRWSVRVLTASTLEDVFGKDSGGASQVRRTPASKRARRR